MISVHQSHDQIVYTLFHKLPHSVSEWLLLKYQPIWLLVIEGFGDNNLSKILKKSEFSYATLKSMRYEYLV